MAQDIYIASRSKTGGIYHFRYTSERKYELIHFTPADNLMYLKIKEQKMYALLREPFGGQESGVAFFEMKEDGSLGTLSQIRSTKGTIACHLEIVDEIVYCANYGSGSVIKIPDCLISYSSENEKVSHPHYIGLTPDGKYLCVTDLGLDKIYLYDKSLNLINAVKMPEGHGVRHLVFSENGRYVFTSNELRSTVSVLLYENGTMKLIETKSCLPDERAKNSSASAIRLQNGRIYVSNRGDDTISELNFDGTKLELMGIFKCEGETPRDFNFQENRIICANQDSDTVTVFEKQTDQRFQLIQKLDIVEPVCVVCK